MSKNDFIGQKYFPIPRKNIIFYDLIIKYFNHNAKLRIMDLGCGTGGLLFKLAALFPKSSFEGIDISDINIKIAEQKLGQVQTKYNLRFILSDYMNYHAGSFDLIIAESSLHNISASTDKLFEKIDSDLVDNGLLMATIPYDCLYNQLLWFLRRLLKHNRNKFIDNTLYKIAKISYGRMFSDEILRDRICYMYLIPHFYLSKSFLDNIYKFCKLKLIKVQPILQVSIAQPKHALAIFKKNKF